MCFSSSSSCASEATAPPAGTLEDIVMEMQSECDAASETSLNWLIESLAKQASQLRDQVSQSSKFSAIVLRLEQEMASNVYGAARLSMDAAVVAAISTCNFLSKASSQDDSVFGMFSAGQRLRSEDTIAGESEIVDIFIYRLFHLCHVYIRTSSTSSSSLFL